MLFQVLEVCSAWLGLLVPRSITLSPFLCSTAYGGGEAVYVSQLPLFLGSATGRNQWEARGFLSPCLYPEVSLRAAATPPQLQLPLDSPMVLSPGL